jgi:hypothetical protein
VALIREIQRTKNGNDTGGEGGGDKGLQNEVKVRVNYYTNFKIKF